MRRTRLSWLLTPVWISCGGLAVLAATSLAPGPILYLTLGALILGPALAGHFIASAADRREKEALSALGEATGIGAIGKLEPIVHMGTIVANLCARLERARLYQTAFEQLGQPALMAEKDGTIVKMSAGLVLRAPACAEKDSVRALLGADVPRSDGPEKTRVHLAGYDWQAVSVPLGQERWLIAFERPGVTIAQGDWHAMTEALAGGETGFRFGAAALAGNPDLEAVNLGFAALDDSAHALAVLARDGEAAAITPANGGLAPHISALTHTVTELARARDEEARGKAHALVRLEKIGALVELCRKSASALTAAAEAARLASDGAREAFEAGRAGAGALAELHGDISGRAGAAGDAARGTVENVAAVETMIREIDGLVAGIEDVSFRTNLLALNAAVEAARAGDKGAGFAVVAAEVRELAQASSRTSKTIRSLVTKSLAQAGTGSGHAKTLIAALSDIDGHLLNLSDETARIEETLDGGSKALSAVQAETGLMVEHARAQADALRDNRDDVGQPEGTRSRRV